MKSIVLNKILSIATLATLSSAMLSSCSVESEFNQQNGNPLKIVADIDLQNNDATSRAYASKETFAANDAIGLWAVPFRVTGETEGEHVHIDLRPYGNYKDNVKYTYMSSSFVTDENIYFPSSSTNMDIYAVFPYDANMSDPQNNTMGDPTEYEFSVLEDQSTEENVTKSDFLSAYSVATPSSGLANLSFKHRFTRILVTFTVPEYYSNEPVNGVVNVQLVNQKLKSKIDITDPTQSPEFVAVGNQLTAITMLKAVAPAYATQGTYVYEAITTPGTVIAEGDDVIVVTLNVSTIGNVTFTAKAKKQIVLEHQKQYNISMSLSDMDEVSFTDVSIAGWGDPIVIEASTSKLSKMIFDVVVEGASSVDPAAIHSNATIFIGEPATGNNASYSIAEITYNKTKEQYELMYDPNGKQGGMLTSINIFKEDGKTDLVKDNSVRYTITGNPSLQDYSDVIGTITFTTASQGTVSAGSKQ